VKVNSAAVNAYMYEHKEVGTGYVQFQKLEISVQAARYQVPQECIEYLLQLEWAYSYFTAKEPPHTLKDEVLLEDIPCLKTLIHL